MSFPDQEYKNYLIDLLDHLSRDQKEEPCFYYYKDNNIGVFARTYEMGAILLHCLKILRDGEESWVFDELDEDCSMQDYVEAVVERTQDEIRLTDLRGTEYRGLDLDTMNLYNYKSVRKALF